MTMYCLAQMTMFKAISSLEFSLNSTPTPISSNCSTDIFKCLNNLMRKQLISESKSCVGHKYFDGSRGQCVDCSTVCPVNSRLEHHCNRTHDIQCVCNSGFFLTTDSGCKPCSQCESGWGKTSIIVIMLCYVMQTSKEITL